jgi:hypothetical protein
MPAQIRKKEIFRALVKVLFFIPNRSGDINRYKKMEFLRSEV